MKTSKIEIDFAKKLIRLRQKCSVKELYFYLQDVFDEPENMKYDIPIRAVSQGKYALINGWKIVQPDRCLLQGDISAGSQEREETAVKINLNNLVSGSVYEVYNITTALTMAIGTAVSPSVEAAGMGANGDFIRIRVRPAKTKPQSLPWEIQTVVVNRTVNVNVNQCLISA